jgi:hypothetical protein
MYKKAIKIQFLFFLLLFISIRSNSQNTFTRELKWLFPGLQKTIYIDTNHIIESGLRNWGTLASYKTKRIRIEENNIFILMVDICSGIYCPSIDIFKEENNKWFLITSSRANLQSRLKIEVDTCKKKLMFKAGTSQIGELPFETLIHSDQ